MFYTYFILTAIWDRNYCHLTCWWLWVAHQIFIYASISSNLSFNWFGPWDWVLANEIWAKNMQATSCANGILQSSLSLLCHLGGHVFQMILPTRWRKIFSSVLCVMWVRNKLLLCSVSKIRGFSFYHSIGHSRGHQAIACGSKMACHLFL